MKRNIRMTLMARDMIRPGGEGWEILSPWDEPQYLGVAPEVNDTLVEFDFPTASS
jgi:hypothetical protein